MPFSSFSRTLVFSLFFAVWPASGALQIISTNNLALVEEGGTLRSGNLAPSGTAFSQDEIGVAPHATAKVIDGTFGNSNSWIAGSPVSFIGVSLGGTPQLVGQIAFGRDNTGTYTDRCLAIYELQYTTVANPDESTPEEDWTTIGTMDYQAPGGPNFAAPGRRHHFSFQPILATGLRLKTISATELICIDELEIYAPGSTPALSNLTASSGALSPAFESTTTAYTLPAVPNAVTSITVTPTLAPSGASLLVNGVASASGSPATVPLAVGANTITILVTAPGGISTTSYTIIVNRAALSGSSNAALSDLTLSHGTLSPLFVATTTAYSLTGIPASTTSLNITPTVAQSGATVMVNSSPATSGAPLAVTLAAGTNTLTVRVTAEDGATTRSYTISVVRGLSLVEQGGTAVGLNIAREARTSATSFVESPLHHPRFLNDGVYGSGSSWVAANADSAIVASFGSDIVNVSAITWSRDNTGGYTDRWRGRYIIEYTQSASPDETTPDSQWQLIGSVDYATLPQVGDFSSPALRHRWTFPAVQASGIRVRALAAAGEAPLAIDELELSTSGPWINVETSDGTPVQSGSPTFFGPTVINQTHSWDYRIRNVGPGELTGLSLWWYDLRYTANASAVTIPPGGAVNLTVQFRATNIGDYTLNLDISSNAASNRPKAFRLSRDTFVGCDPQIGFVLVNRPPFAVGFPVNHKRYLMMAQTHPGTVYTLIDGTLPPGLTLQLDGRITGTATQVGSYNFTLRATDAISCLAHPFSDTLTVANIGWIAGGGSFAPRNLALGHGTFAKDNLDVAPHSPNKVNDGIYGNSSAWIAGSSDSFVGISFGASSVTINRAAFSRDNTLQLNDRNIGRYTLQYTTVPNPDASTPDSSWTTLETMQRQEEFDLPLTNRNLFGFTPPIQVTGVRLMVRSHDASLTPMAIDELELYGPDPAPAWRTQHFGAATANIGDLDDFDGDGIANLLEFAQGTLPNNAARRPLSYSGNVITPGQPVSDGTNAVFIRRKDRIAAGITYTVEFSPDLTTWTPMSTAATVLADDGTNEVVSVPMPALQTRHFFRVKVNSVP